MPLLRRAILTCDPTGVAKPLTSGVERVAASRQTPLNAAIGAQVRAARLSLDMTISDLAKAASLSVGMLSKIENGQTSASLSTLQSLASRP